MFKKKNKEKKKKRKGPVVHWRNTVGRWRNRLCALAQHVER
jgi:hypothetical protein